MNILTTVPKNINYKPERTASITEVRYMDHGSIKATKTSKPSDMVDAENAHEFNEYDNEYLNAITADITYKDIELRNTVKNYTEQYYAFLS